TRVAFALGFPLNFTPSSEMSTGFPGAAAAWAPAGAACLSAATTWSLVLPALTEVTTVDARPGLRGQVLSFTRHSAIPIPQPQSQPCSFIMSRARSLAAASSPVKSTPASPSRYWVFCVPASALGGAEPSRAPLAVHESRSARADRELSSARFAFTRRSSLVVVRY